MKEKISFRRFMLELFSHFKIWIIGLLAISFLFIMMFLGYLSKNIIIFITNYIKELQDVHGMFLIIAEILSIIFIPYLFGILISRLINPKETENNLFLYYKKLERDGMVNINTGNINGDVLYTIHYSDSDIDFSNSFIRLARGTTINKNGDVVLKSPNKYFAYNELKENPYYTDEFKEEYTMITDKNRTFPYIEKMAGKMVLAGEYKDSLVVSSRYSLNDNLAHEARNYLEKNNKVDSIIDICKKFDVTLVFDFCNPKSENVMPCKQETMYLVAVTSNNYTVETLFDDGYYELLNRFGKILDMSVPKIQLGTLEDIMKKAKTEKFHRGYVVFNEYKKRIKFKTDWWINALTDKSQLKDAKDRIEIAEIIIELWQSLTANDILQNIEYDKNIDDNKKKMIKDVSRKISKMAHECRRIYNNVYYLNENINDIMKDNSIPPITRELCLNYNRYGSIFPADIDKERIAKEILEYQDAKIEEMINE